MEIKRPNTKKFKHYTARTIAGFQVIGGDDYSDTDIGQPYINFTGDKGTQNYGREVILPMTINAWDRAANGAGVTSKELCNGIDKSCRFKFQIMTDTVDGVETVVGVHCYPDENYILCDFSNELGENIGDNTAVVNLYPSGEIDVVAFPGALDKDIKSFVSELEKVESIDNKTKITTSMATYTVSSAFGDQVKFTARINRK